MKIVTRTPRKVILEVEKIKIEKCGFDFVWDEIRDKFPEDKFGKLIVDQESNLDIVVFELLDVKERKKKVSEKENAATKKKPTVKFKKETVKKD